MSGKIMNTQDRPEEKPLTEQELQFCDLYVNGGLEYTGRPKKCFVEVSGEDTVKNPHASANYLTNRLHVLVHIEALLSSEQFEMETTAVELQVAETLKAVMGETATSDHTDRFGAPLSPVLPRAVSVNAVKALMDILPIRHKEESRLRTEDSDGSVILNVIVSQNPMTDGEKET